jgi:glycosyltransferase involved in cell wall biosynthesis
MPELIARDASRLRIVALVHLPPAAEVSIDRDTAARLEAAERRALAGTVLVIVTSTATLPMLARYELPRDRVIVVEPGTDRAPLARGSQGSMLQLLSVATLNAAKGHEILLRALADVPYRNWRLICAGSLTRDPATVDRVRDMTRTLGLEDRVSLVGELDAARLSDCYGRADLFVLATLQETYGMAVAEALACGLPVVSTTTGAIAALVGEDAGLLVPPGNIEALAAALARVIGDAGLRARLAEGAQRVRDCLPSWEYASRNMSMALARLDTRG